MEEGYPQRLGKIESLLDNFEAGIGLPPNLKPKTPISDYLSLTRAQLAKMSPSDLAGINFELKQFVFHLQREINKRLVRAKWAEREILKDIAPHLKEYMAPSFEERKLKAIYDGEYATQLSELKLTNDLMVTQLEFVVNRINEMAEAIKTYMFATSRKRDDND